MGTDINVIGGAIYTANGMKLCDITEGPGLQDIVFNDYPDTVSAHTEIWEPPTFAFTAEVKYPKLFRCHSRKRFIKLLMSTGKDKRTEQALALLYWYMKVPYSTAWMMYVWEAL